MRKILNASIVISIFLVASLVFVRGSELDASKTIERLHELIPDHEIKLTREEIHYPGRVRLLEGLWKIVVGRLPESQVEIERVSGRVEAFQERYKDFIDLDRLHEKYKVWSLGGYGGVFFEVGIEGPIFEHLEDFVSVFYEFQDASKAIGAGIIGKDIPIVLYESGPTIVIAEPIDTDQYSAG